MITVELEKVEREQNDDTPLMFHITTRPGNEYALCGKKFATSVTEQFDDISEIDCIVCAEMWRNL